MKKSRGFHHSAGADWRPLLDGKRRRPVGFSFAGLRPLVLIGDILSPGGRGWGDLTAGSGVAPVVFGGDSLSVSTH